MKLKYNSPVFLTFSLLSTLILILSQILGENIILQYFAVPGNQSAFNILSLDAFRLFSHILGHQDWTHLLGNFTFLLLLGPILEEKYGSVSVLLMIMITAFATGILNVIFFPYGLLGASGIVFMCVLLISFTNIKAGELPITFILVVAIYLTGEIIKIFDRNNVSEFAHIIGGVCGGIFGFLSIKVKNKQSD